MKFTFGGGINELNDIAISQQEAVSGQNFDLGLGNTKFKPRRPFDLIGTATNTSSIHGIHQLIKRNGTKTTLVAAGTDMYTFDGTTWTDVGNVDADAEFKHFDWPLDQTIIIVDREKQNPVLEWDGTTLSALTHGIGGVTNFYAKYGIVANGRVFLANVTTDSDENPHMIVASAFENRQSYDTSTRAGDAGFSTGDEAFYILTPDLKPINGLVSFMNLIICSTEDGKLYKLVGDDSTNYRWDDFYAGSAAIGDNSFIDAGNDVYYMRAGGVIESLRSTDTYGDVGTDDISLPVRDTLKDSTGMRAVYDRTNRKILFFLQNKVVVLFKDLLGSGSSPFTIYKTLHPSSFLTSAAEYLERPDSTNKTVLFGDENGNLFDLNGTYGQGDAGSYDLTTNRKLPLQEFNYNTVLSGRVFYRRYGSCELNILFDWGDERNRTGVIIPLKGGDDAEGSYFGGGVYFGGDFYFNEGLNSDRNPVSGGFSAIGKGSSVFATFEVTTSSQFEIDYVEV